MKKVIPTQVTPQKVEKEYDSDEELKTMIRRSKNDLEAEYKRLEKSCNPRSFTRSHNQIKTPPAHYVCHRCHQKGHFINQCPTNGDPNYDFVRKPSRSNTYLNQKDKKPQGTAIDESKHVMKELQCLICHKLLVNPYISPCCKLNFCKHCIENKLRFCIMFLCPNCNKRHTKI